MADIKILREEQLRDVICVIVGTRPSIVKMSPIIRELKRRSLPFFVIHAGQHYSFEMDRQFFIDLELPEPEFHLDNVKDQKLHGAQTAEMLKGIESVLLEEKPRLVMVCGDANFNLAGALAARKLRIQVAHTESGLRSFDWTMPEEHNRVMIDHISEYLFAPTEQCRQHLIEDNVKGQIEVVGNTIVDAVYQNKEIASRRSKILDQLSLKPGEYFLCTSHREENVDIKERFESILSTLMTLIARYHLPVIYPIHPRSQKRLSELGLEDVVKGLTILHLIEPVGYLDFLELLSNSRLVLTDSGGVQEESCILHVPCVTLRDNTERPETLDVGSNMIAGVQPENVMAAVEEMLSRPREWENPYGDGHASERMIDLMTA